MNDIQGDKLTEVEIGDNVVVIDEDEIVADMSVEVADVIVSVMAKSFSQPPGGHFRRIQACSCRGTLAALHCLHMYARYSSLQYREIIVALEARICHVCGDQT